MAVHTHHCKQQINRELLPTSYHNEVIYMDIIRHTKKKKKRREPEAAARAPTSTRAATALYLVGGLLSHFQELLSYAVDVADDLLFGGQALDDRAELDDLVAVGPRHDDVHVAV